MRVKFLIVSLGVTATLMAVGQGDGRGMGMGGQGQGMGSGQGMGQGMGMGQAPGQNQYRAQHMNTFKNFDKDGDGFMQKSEFQHMRTVHQREREQEGRMMKNADKAPSFETMDTNGDKKISHEEFKAYHLDRMK